MYLALLSLKHMTVSTIELRNTYHEIFQELQSNHSKATATETQQINRMFKPFSQYCFSD